MVDKKEIEILKEYVKGRFDELHKDYQEFDTNAFIDSSLTYKENLLILTEKLNLFLQKEIPKTKAECYDKSQEEFMLKKEIEKVETQAKLLFEEQLNKIANTPTSVLLDKIYLIPKEYIKMVVNKKSKGLLLWGSAGLGKSFSVKRIIKESNLKEGEEYVFISGHITPMQFYKKLYENKDTLVCLDDINILESKINLNMLKACLSDNCSRVEYESSSLKDIPSSFVFTGRVIILLNEKPKNDENLKAVESRILTYHLEMDYKTKISIIYDIAKAEYDGLTLKERQEIAIWIKNNTNESTKNLSIRLLFMCFEFYKWNKEIWVELARGYIQNDIYVNLIIQGCSKEDWTEKTGLSIRTMQRYKQQMRAI